MNARNKGTHISLTPKIVLAVAMLIALNSQSAESPVSQALLRLRELNVSSFRGDEYPSPNSGNKNLSAFRKLLTETATIPPTPTDTPDEAALLRVSHAVDKNPQSLADLLKTYGHTTIPSRIARPTGLQATHLTEVYRPAWEALLLAPRCPTIDIMENPGMITEALHTIGNPDSIPVLELAFRLTCEPGVNAGKANSWPVDRQASIIHALSGFPAEDSLRVILRLLDQAESAMANSGQSPVRFGNQTLSAMAVRLLTHQNDPKKEEQWRQVLANFHKGTLPARQRELFESAIVQKEPEKQ